MILLFECEDASGNFDFVTASQLSLLMTPYSVNK